MHENNRINNSNISKVCTFAIYQFKGNKRKQSVFNVVFSCAATNSVYNLILKKDEEDSFTSTFYDVKQLLIKSFTSRFQIIFCIRYYTKFDK